MNIDFPLVPFDQLILPASLWAELSAYACQALPHECCGLLAGTIHRRQGYITHVLPIPNELASPTAYRTQARAMLAAFRRLRQLQRELLGIYHSHPRTSAQPSRRDLAENTYGATVAHLIISLAGPRPQLGCWRLLPTRYQALPCYIVSD
jgi:proteasome lid subunit RPN8/RPN11